MTQTTTPHRPQHLDYDLLEAILSGIEGEAERAQRLGQEFSYADLVAQVVDKDSLAYMALRRAAHVMGIVSEEDVRERGEELMRLAAAFHDGFTMGVRFWQTKTSTPVPPKRAARSGDPRKRAQA